LIGQILEIISGITGFMDYVADYFKERRIVKQAERAVKCEQALEACLKSKAKDVNEARHNCKAAIIEKDAIIASLQAEIESMKNVNKTAREISG